MEKHQAVYNYLNDKGWVVLDDPEEQVLRICTSETNENYLIAASELSGETRYLFRVSHGSHLGLVDQIEYEFAVLQALKRSGVTPRPYFVDSEPGRLGDGVLLMEYLPGRVLNYAGDWELAARILAAVHSQPADDRLLREDNPIGEMIRECQSLSERFKVGQEALKSGYLACMDDLLDLEAQVGGHDAVAPDAICHGTVCSSDFLINDEMECGWLIDWERGMVTSRYADLGQFMAQAALAGEMGFCRNTTEKKQFIAAYCAAAGMAGELDFTLARAEFFEQAATLRSMIWNCVALTGNYVGACV